ncbi:PadR family transcriptional regulator [Synechococcales cyanobacterium C]|uniref:PadR family transcriptional regulator n=1 Tax=Petrachloros mirabilis ULC683 TaxID=2781853 RepID=A0A8K2A8Q0_9CYAN|nr:PadR family transcriptional regulator [Petrachloros mirabilis]NCJ07419.1 PadR family transcriptional regulator [Petrachloros mirabilis ULC683]
MALVHTILTLLCDHPASGYDISKQFEESVACYWKASQQQIYRELGKMEGKGWVAFELVPQAGKPDKKIYAITETGHQELLRWYQEPTEPTPIREDLLVKVLGGAYLPNPILIQELQRRRQTHLEQMLRYQEREAQYQSNPHPSLQDRYRYLTLRRGIRYEQDWIHWCDEVLVLLKQPDGGVQGYNALGG